ncbi:hypothetical protein BDN72DRAFT_848765 [Pluteus cervinus]|uniref:Uncharacterized protein n=1 Tax=Pluteus cervinus TaxID=181527 RepID=A0ACD3A9N6_9AGAR|nr:hypothetical protein BDN72DRAFT_848765 [Pluteus cervinus]
MVVDRKVHSPLCLAEASRTNILRQSSQAPSLVPSLIQPDRFNEPSGVQASSEQSSSPINHLPPELLTRIFIYIRRMALNHVYPSDHGKRPVLWWVVNEVCHRWRDIAQESAILWSYIPPSYPGPLIKRCLELSSSVPLVVHINKRTTKDQVYPPLKAALSRFRCLRISTFKSAFQELSFLQSNPAPLLESLSIDLSGPNRNGRFVLDNLCAGVTPRLRNVSLQGCGINLSSPFLANLSILEIRDPTPKFSGTAFLAVLRGLPSLVSLRMCRALQPPEDQTGYTQIPDTEVVILPSLRLLSVYGNSYVQDLDFLSHLSFPSTTILLFASDYPYHSRRPIAALSDFLRIHAQLFTPTKVVLDTVYGRLKLDLMNDDKTLCAFKMDSRSDMTPERHRLQCGPDLDELLSYLSISTITHLSTSFYVPPSAWPLNQLSVATILSATGIIEDFQTKSDLLWTPNFPHLRTLHLMHVVLDDNCKEGLVQALRARSTASCGLKKLVIDKCPQIDDDFVSLLGAVDGLNAVRFDGLNAVRCLCDGTGDEEKYLRRGFDYDHDLDAGEIIRPVGEIDPRLYVHSYLQDRDI